MGYYKDIDQDNLDKELVFLSTECDMLCFEKEKLLKDLRNEESKLSSKESEIRLSIVKDPSSFGLAKATEAIIDAKLKELLHLNYTARDEVKNRLDAITLRMTALDMRRRSVEQLIQLFLNSYYGDCHTRPGTNKGVV